jgi:hypothetical protein
MAFGQTLQPLAAARDHRDMPAAPGERLDQPCQHATAADNDIVLRHGSIIGSHAAESSTL